MKRSLFLMVAFTCAVESCALDGARKSSHEHMQEPKDTRYLAQSFRVGEAFCEIDEVNERVTELTNAPQKSRVSPDIRVLDVSIACATSDGTALRTSEVLPKDLVILLRDGKGRLSAPSTRTWLSKREPEHVVFELNDASVLAKARRFDAQTGARKKGDEHRPPSELWLSATSLSVRVLLKHAYEDDAFEASLVKLARDLSEGAEPEGARRAWSELSELHRSILEATRARTLTITAEPQSAQHPVLALSYGGFGRDAVFQIPTIYLELEKTANQAAPYQLAGTRDALSVRHAIRCAERARELEAMTQRAYESATGETECNVLGLLWPSACQDVGSEVIQRAALVRSDCAMNPLEPLISKAVAVPEDFQLTLRRGREGGPLDRTPRYIVALFSNGAISFHGQHWVGSLGRSDGRTSPKLLGALLRYVSDLSWFDRKGGEWNEDGCDPSEDNGHVITVHAHERERMVLDRDGCRGPFKKAELDELITLVEQVAFVNAWTTQRPQYADRKAKVWTVTDD